ncbi:MAG: hypothetical protein ABL880_00700 [Methylotenera sp.]
MPKLGFYIFIILFVFSKQASAEIYKNFLPYSSLAMIKAKYPNAKLEDIKAAWLKENEAFIGLTGVGIIGAINLKFSTSDDYWKTSIESTQREIESNPTADNSIREYDIADFNGRLNLPLDQRLTLDWLRWVPPQAIPFDRIVSKYGKPEKCDFDVDTYQPYCAWTSKGVSANLSDNKKYVYFIEYTFTLEDLGLEKPKPELKRSNKNKKAK